MQEPWDEVDGSDIQINRRVDDDERMLFGTPPFVRVFDRFGQTSIPPWWSRPLVLHDSELGAAWAPYVHDDRDLIDEPVVVAHIEVKPGWGELVLPPEASSEIEEVFRLIWTPRDDWRLSDFGRSLLSRLNTNDSLVGVSVPIPLGRIIWVPWLSFVTDKLAARGTSTVRARRRQSKPT